MYDPPTELVVLIMLLKGASEGLSRSGDGFLAG